MRLDPGGGRPGGERCLKDPGTGGMKDPGTVGHKFDPGTKPGGQREEDPGTGGI